MRIVLLVGLVLAALSSSARADDDDDGPDPNKKACRDAFRGDDNKPFRKQCVKLTKGERDLATSIKQCKVTTFPHDEQLNCIAAAVRSPQRDPQPAIANCYVIGGAQEWQPKIKCVALALPARYNIATAILACDHLSTDDDVVLSCIGIAAAMKADATPSIESCKKQASGDAARISCVKKINGSYSPPPDTTMSLADAAKACEPISYSTGERDSCVKALLAAKFDGRAAVATCISLSYSTTERLSCVSSAMTAHHEPTAGIKACIQLSFSTSERLTCVKSAAAAKTDPAPAIAGCIKLSFSTSERLTCVATAGAASFGAEVIAKCVELSYSTGERLTCLTYAATLKKRQPVEVIDYCIKKSYSTSERLTCIKTIE